MNMRLPDSGSVLSSLLDLGTPTGLANSGDTLQGVTEAQLLQAIDSLQRGHVEFVVLEDGEAFLQAAGDGDGPYWVQYSASDNDTMIELPDGVDFDTMRSVMLAYRREDLAWRIGRVWVPVQ